MNFIDLKYKFDDLCQFINSNCKGNIGSVNTSSTVPLMKMISFIPLQLHGH